MRNRTLFISTFFFLIFQLPGASFAQVGDEVQRETSRLERMAGRVWEGLLEETRYGVSIDERTRLDVFNFVNGVRALREKAAGRRARTSDLTGVLGLIRLQTKVVDRSLKGARVGRFVMRDWDDAKASLESLARLVAPRKRRAGQVSKNTNNLQVQIREVRPVGNIFKNEYRIRGTISGRNIVSAGIYAQDRLVKPITVRLHERQLTESSFAVRLQALEGEVEIRVIDSRGFVLEHPVEFPAKSLIPKF